MCKKEWRTTLPMFLIIVFFSFPHLASGQNFKTLPTNIDISKSSTGIVSMPKNVDKIFNDFDRYTKILAPNGKPIHIVVESGYSDRQVIYARKILVNHLTNLPGTKYGHDKTTIANAIANNQSILFLFKDTKTFQGWFRSIERKGFEVNGQDLRAYETILEGTDGYMAQKNPTRDASYEEIMHFVQQWGIEQAHPTLSQDLFDAFWDARAKNIYLLDYDETHEYFICGFEAYYDMWAHDPENDGTRENEYIPISNASLKVYDPKMYNIVEEYMGKHWLYMAEVVDEFDGTFSLLKEEQKTYTNKSQYLRKAALTGNNNNDLTGNKFDNSLFGNSGNNNIKPLGGFDIVDGGPGDDTAIFMGKKSEYILRNQDGRIIVDDINYWRDGQNILINMEKLKFLDKTINVTDTRK
tara:strand:+ start:304 stop:1533 length:1230 start_codon:yes stop_codon:yes gene_type:complete